MKQSLFVALLLLALAPVRAADTPSAAVPAQPSVQERLDRDCEEYRDLARSIADFKSRN